MLTKEMQELLKERMIKISTPGTLESREFLEALMEPIHKDIVKGTLPN